jgi:hypothetical protein
LPPDEDAPSFFSNLELLGPPLVEEAPS